MFRTFDSLEEAAEAIRRDREAADKHIKSWQRKLAPGDKVLRIVDFYGSPVLVYGEIIDPIELERPHYDLSDPEQAEMFENVKAQYGGEWLDSYRFGRFYSPLCEHGELGDIHLAMVDDVISDEDFELARQANWPQDALLFAVPLNKLSKISKRR